jgi:hypothetical protein
MSPVLGSGWPCDVGPCFSAEGCGLALGRPEEAGPTHFPVQGNFNPTVIDLMFVPVALLLTMVYEIHTEDRGHSDHAFLSVVLPGPDSMVPATRWASCKDSDEEVAYKAAILARLQPLLDWRGNSPAEIEGVVSAISEIFARAWSDHAKESQLSSHSKEWWTDSCSDALAEFRTTRSDDDWLAYRRAMRTAKRDFFEERIHEVASENWRPWDLTSWIHERNLPSYKAISYRGVPCMDLESLSGLRWMDRTTLRLTDR